MYADKYGIFDNISTRELVSFWAFFPQKKRCRNSTPHLLEPPPVSTPTRLLALPPFFLENIEPSILLMPTSRRYSGLPASHSNQCEAEIHRSCMHIYMHPSSTCILGRIHANCSEHMFLDAYVGVVRQPLCVSVILPAPPIAGSATAPPLCARLQRRHYVLGYSAAIKAVKYIHIAVCFLQGLAVVGAHVGSMKGEGTGRSRQSVFCLK